jgi:hypothetical protein
VVVELVTVGFQKLKFLKLQKNGQFQHVSLKHFFYYFFLGEMVILDRIGDRISQLHTAHKSSESRGVDLTNNGIDPRWYI